MATAERLRVEVRPEQGAPYTGIARTVEAVEEERAKIRSLIRGRVAERLGTACPHGAVFGDPCVPFAAQPEGYCPTCVADDARALHTTGSSLPTFALFRDNMAGDSECPPLHLTTEHIDREVRDTIDALAYEWLDGFGGRVVDPFEMIAGLRIARVCETTPETDRRGRFAVLVMDASLRRGHEDQTHYEIAVSWRDGRIKQRERALIGACYLVLAAYGVASFDAVKYGRTEDERRAASEAVYQAAAYFARSLLAPTRELRAALASGADLRERFPWASRDVLRARLRDLRDLEAAHAAPHAEAA